MSTKKQKEHKICDRCGEVYTYIGKKIHGGGKRLIWKHAPGSYQCLKNQLDQREAKKEEPHPNQYPNQYNASVLEKPQEPKKLTRDEKVELSREEQIGERIALKRLKKAVRAACSCGGNSGIRDCCMACAVLNLYLTMRKEEKSERRVNREPVDENYRIQQEVSYAR
jgi:hypothetical protein